MKMPPMKALAVHPGTPHSLHLREIERPSLEAVPDGRGVLVKVLQVGVDATDMEINEALYGNPPEGNDFLVIGHEVFGQVEATGSIPEVRPGGLDADRKIERVHHADPMAAAAGSFLDPAGAVTSGRP